MATKTNLIKALQTAVGSKVTGVLDSDSLSDLKEYGFLPEVQVVLTNTGNLKNKDIVAATDAILVNQGKAKSELKIATDNSFTFKNPFENIKLDIFGNNTTGKPKAETNETPKNELEKKIGKTGVTLVIIGGLVVTGILIYKAINK